VDLRRLQHFSVLAETLNFRIAAERTYLTQPAFTRSIASLERELGTRLFTRDKRRVALTAEGAALLEQARALLRDADALARAASALGARGRQELRVGFYGTALAELTHPILQAFHERCPNVSITVSDVTFDRAVEPLLCGELDIGLLRAQSDVPSLTAVPLFTEPANVQLPASHRAANERSVDVCDLVDDAWVALPEATPAEWNRYWVCAEQNEGEPPEIGGRGRTITEVASLVAFKELVALVPGSTARRPLPGVRSVALRGVDPCRVVVMFPSSPPRPLIEAFLETATEVTRRKVSMVPGAEPLV
jgi:DNA-binding transcriptional LysR family regulator